MDWRYLAGFVDGEGSICLSRGGSYRYKNVPRVPTYRPWFAISNNHRGVLELIREFVGLGTIQNHPRSNPNAKPGYSFQVGGLCIEPVLRGLHPYLIIKKRQAEVALSFIERRRHQRTRPFTEEDYAFVEEMRRLNDRHPGRGAPIQPLPKPRHRAVYGSIGSKNSGHASEGLGVGLAIEYSGWWRGARSGCAQAQLHKILGVP